MSASISQRLASAGLRHVRDAKSVGPYAHSIYNQSGAFLGSFTALDAYALALLLTEDNAT